MIGPNGSKLSCALEREAWIAEEDVEEEEEEEEDVGMESARVIWKGREA
jgi:hypothetical protein